MVLGIGEVFGEIEMFKEYEISMYNVVCQEDNSEYFTLKYEVSVVLFIVVTYANFI